MQKITRKDKFIIEVLKVCGATDEEIKRYLKAAAKH